MSAAIDTLFRESKLRPVLMDIGATGEPPALWAELAPHSTYLGIGPAATPSHQSLINKFQKSHTIEKIVTLHEIPQVSLCLMKNPIYSSLFEAHPQAITDFLDPHLEPAGETSLPATTVDSIVSSYALPGIDWLHTNINGLDVPIFKHLSRDLRNRVLALDSCLDLVDLYINQQSGVARYPELIGEGFWLSRSFTDGPVRMRHESFAKLQILDPGLDERCLIEHHRRTPGWIFVRFLRTLESLAERDAPSRDYVLLWTFALLDNQFGFCADLVLGYERRFGRDRALHTMQSETLARLQRLKPANSLRSISTRYLPAPVRRGLRRMLGKTA